jgi:hypothetical protein
MAKDKRIECNCHIGCTTEDHACAMPCTWPSCLTEEEHARLVEELTRLEEWF